MPTFRCGLKALEKGLASAVTRGVMIHAPEAHTNTGGRKGLRALDCACSKLALPCSFGSQSLRKLELDERREVGVIVRAAAIVKDIERIFEDDWQRAGRK